MRGGAQGRRGRPRPRRTTVNGAGETHRGRRRRGRRGRHLSVYDGFLKGRSPMAASEELARRVVEAGRSCSLHHAVLEEWRGSAPRNRWSTWRGYLEAERSEPRGLEARDAAQALRAAGAQALERLRLVGRVVAGGHGARVAARSTVGAGRTCVLSRHRQDAHAASALCALACERTEARFFHGVLARDAPEARPRRREARPGGRAYRQGPPLGNRPNWGSSHSTRTGRGCSPGFAEAYERQSVVITHESGVQQVGVV